MDLNALQSLLAVVTHGGFAAASRRLGAPKSTLSRHVRDLEEELGVRLLDRSARSLRLTSEGEVLCERAGSALAEIDDAERALRALDGPPRGPLRVAVPHVFAHRRMGRLAATFVARYPEVHLEVVLADHVADLVAESLDAAIVLDPPDNAELVIRTLASESLWMVASPKLVRARARTPAETPWPAVVPSRPLRGPHSVALGERVEAATTHRTWALTEGARRFQAIARPVLRLPSKLVILDAVLAGAGAALLPSSLVEDLVGSTKLTRIGVLEGRYALSLVHSSRRLVSGRLRAFLDFMIEAHAKAKSRSSSERDTGSAKGRKG